MNRRFPFLVLVFTLVFSTEVSGQEKKSLKYKGKTTSDWLGLLATVEKREQGDEIVEALKSLGPEAEKAAIPVLMERMHDRCPSFRAHTAWYVKEFKAYAQPTIPVLLSLLKDENKDVRWQACWTLKKMRLESAKVLPVVLQHLKDPNADICANACQILGSLGPQAKEAVAPLIDVLEHENRDVRLEAIQSLGSIGLPARAAVPQLKKALLSLEKANDNYYEYQLIETLVNIDPESKSLQKELWDFKKGTHRKSILATVRSNEAAAKNVVQLFEKGFADENPECRREAALALWQIQKRKEVIPFLLQALEYELPATSPAGSAGKRIDGEVYRLLPQFGSAAKPALPVLERMFWDSGHEERDQVMETIRAVDPDTAKRIERVLNNPLIPPQPTR
jgi:HEAT repeat protein